MPTVNGIFSLVPIRFRRRLESQSSFYEVEQPPTLSESSYVYRNNAVFEQWSKKSLDRSPI